MYENQRSECYTRLKNLIKDQDHDIAECILLVNQIKEHRHRNIKAKQVNKFDRLLKKQDGYLYKFSYFSTFSGHTSFDGHACNTSNTNAQANIITSSVTTIVSALTSPIAPTITTTSATTSLPVHTALLTNNKRAINLYSTPLTPA